MAVSMKPRAARRPSLRGAGSTARAWSRAHVVEVVFIVAGLIARIGFWQGTGRKFEDGLITVTHARNAADGLGLTHHPFEPVTHGFTSAVSVLVPLVGELLSFIPNVDGFLVLRLTSLVAFVITIVAASRIAGHLGLGMWPRIIVYAVLALQFNQIFYAMSGMETQIAVCVLLCAIAATMEERAVPSGLLYGLAVLTRPDFVIFVVVAAVWWLFRDRRAGLKVAALAAAVLAPWIIFTAIYYGSPIPNTIPAKELRHTVRWPHTFDPGAWWDFLVPRAAGRESWLREFMAPFWEHVSVAGAPVKPLFAGWFTGTFLLLAAAGMTASWRVRGWLPVVAFLLIYFVYRLIALPPGYYDWYYPPISALVAILAAVALQRIWPVARRAVIAVAIVVIAGYAWALPPLTVLEARVQREVEANSRVPLGLWLRGNVRPGEVVTSESAGYVGYYASPNIKLWDYPGLTSKEAYEIMKILGPDRSRLEWLVHAALPDYAIWRPRELPAFVERFPEDAAMYQEIFRTNSQTPEERLRLGGVALGNSDEEFVVMKRVSGELGGVARARQIVREEKIRFERERGR